MRGVAISNIGISAGDGAVVLSGNSTNTYNLGTGAEPGGNTILGNDSARQGIRVNVPGATVQAVGNTWVASQQGASAAGTYSGNVLVTSGSGENYVVTGGSLRLAGN